MVIRHSPKDQVSRKARIWVVIGALAATVTAAKIIASAAFNAAEVNRSPARLTAVEAEQAEIRSELAILKGSFSVVQQQLKDIDGKINSQNEMLIAIRNYSKIAAQSQETKKP